MKRVAAFVAVFLAGGLVGYLLAPRVAPSPEPAPADAVAASPGPSSPPPSLPSAEETPPPPALLPAPTEARPPVPGAPAAPGRPADDGRVAVGVRLVLPDGSVPAQGRIHWATVPNAPVRSMRRRAWEAPVTRLALEPGDVWLLATAGAREEFKSEAMPLQVSAQGPEREVVLTLAARTGVLGKVVLPGEFQRARLGVSLQALADDRTPAEPTFDRTDPQVQVSERDGFRFAFHDLAPGVYLLGLSLAHDVYPVTARVRVSDVMVEQDLVLERFDPARYMEVTVLGPDGQPIRDAQVSVSFSGEGGSVAGGNVSLLRADGVFVVDHLPRFTRAEDGTYKDGIYTMHVRTAAYGELVRPYDPKSTKTLTIAISESAPLTVRLRDYVGSAAVGLLHVALRAAGERGLRNPKAVEADGSVLFGRVAPGPYEVVIRAGRARAATVAVHAIEVGAGGDVHELPTPVFHRVVVRGPSSPGEVFPTLSRSFGGESWSFPANREHPPGEWVFELLTEGTYALEARVGERVVRREVRVPAESVVQFD